MDYLILESKEVTWVIMVAVDDGLNPRHLSVSIRLGKITVTEL